MELTREVRELFFRYDRNAPLHAEEQVEEIGDGLERLHFSILSVRRERVAGHLYYRPHAHAQLILLQHGAGGSKADDYIEAIARAWAPRGWAVAAIDAPLHGERAGGHVFNPAEFVFQPFALVHLQQQAVADLMRAVDYLYKRPEVDSGPVAFVGFSLGTIMGVPFVAMDERVRVAAFLLGGGGLLDLALPFVPEEMRPDLIAASELADPVMFAPFIAPRPVLMLNTLGDQVVPRQLTVSLYGALGEPKKMVWVEGGHSDLTAEHIQLVYEFVQTAIAKA
jgi:dienelactone hydrolase